MKISGKGLLALASACALVVPAQADVQWMVDAVFSDGATLTGTFSINLSGELYDFDLTSSGPNGVHYKLGTDAYNLVTTDNSIRIEPGPYFGDLYLAFSNDIRHGPIEGSVLSTQSYECEGSYSCFQQSGPFVRTIAGGTVSGTSFDGQPYTGPVGPSDVPEPGAWAMMIAGFAAIGAGLRRRAKGVFATR